MEKMRTSSFSELPSNNLPPLDDPHVLEGVSVNLKLLLKLIHEHHDSARESVDSRRPQRIATMLAIIDDIRNRVVKTQALSTVKRKPELRRCATELHRHSNNSKEKKVDHTGTGTGTGKGLEKMFASLGKEKEMIASELSRKVQELSSMEETINDLRARNDRLSEKVRACAIEHKEKAELTENNGCGGDDEVVVGLQERNKALTEQMMKAVDGCMSMKRRLREMAVEAGAGFEKVRVLRKKCGNEEGFLINQGQYIMEELSLVERGLAGFYRRLSMMSSLTPGGIPRESPKKGD